MGEGGELGKPSPGLPLPPLCVRVAAYLASPPLPPSLSVPGPSSSPLWPGRRVAGAGEDAAAEVLARPALAGPRGRGEE